MVESILAQDAHDSRIERLRAIRERTSRGLLSYNTGKVHQIADPDLWAVPSTRGGFHKVDLGAEVCDCEDYTFFGSERGIGCRHIYAAAIAREKRRLWLRRAARAIAPIFVDGGDDRDGDL